MVEGYNIAFKIGGKTICGRTQDDLTIAARLTESITKDDAGDTKVTVSGHDVTFSASGMVIVSNSDNTKLDRDEVMEQALKKGSNAPVNITYVAAGGDTYAGSAIITQYRESSNSTDIATWQADFRISGSFTKSGSGA